DEVAWARGFAGSDEHLLAMVVLLKCFGRLGYFPAVADGAGGGDRARAPGSGAAGGRRGGPRRAPDGQAAPGLRSPAVRGGPELGGGTQGGRRGDPGGRPRPQPTPRSDQHRVGAPGRGLLRAAGVLNPGQDGLADPGRGQRGDLRRDHRAGRAEWGWAASRRCWSRRGLGARPTWTGSSVRRPGRRGRTSASSSISCAGSTGSATPAGGWSRSRRRSWPTSPGRPRPPTRG